MHDACIVKRLRTAGTNRSLCLPLWGRLCLTALAIFLTSLPIQAFAMSWQWIPGENADRLVLNLDAPGQPRSVTRLSATELELRLAEPARDFLQTGELPHANALFLTPALEGSRVRIRLSPRVARYAVTRPTPHRLAIDFFTTSRDREADAPPATALEAPAPETLSATQELRTEGFDSHLLRRQLHGENTIAFSRLREVSAIRQPANKKSAAQTPSPGQTGAFFFSTPAHAAGIASNASGEPDGAMRSRNDVRGRVNTGGPEDWPESKGISTVTLPGETILPVGDTAGTNAGQSVPGNETRAPVENASAASSPVSPLPETSSREIPPTENVFPVESPRPAQPEPLRQEALPAGNVPNPGAETTGAVTQKSRGMPVSRPGEGEAEGQDAAGEAAPREVIYVDEQGNPVPKPLEPEKMLVGAQRLLDEKKYDDALLELQQIRVIPDISPEMREAVLYHISDCYWARYGDNPQAGFEAIVTSANEALNFNVRSPRVPEALLRIGLAHLSVGDIETANGYIVAASRRYPDYPGLAQGFTALGEELFKRGKFAKAEEAFSTVLDKYPESSQLQTASVGLAKALVNQKKYDRAHIILDFINKRWPRYYVEEPSFLLMQAETDEALNNKGKALHSRWLLLNLDPDRPGNDRMMLSMADAYMGMNNSTAADFLYREIKDRYPDSPEAVTARLRLAEKGIYKSPLAYENMSSVFARGADPPLWQVYSEVADFSKTDPEAVLARLKQAMWLYWDKQYTEAMGKAADFIDAYPEHPDKERARDIIWMAFQKELANSLAEQNHGRILILWNGFPLVRERYGEPDARLRYALARGWMERGNDAQGLKLLDDFLKSPMDPQFGEAAFTEFFNRYLAAGEWGKILDLGERVSTWNMRPELRRQLDYAMALSAQNLNLTGPALAMWKKLADLSEIPLYQRAYATYFLARDAEQRRDIKDAYAYNKTVIDLFTQLQDERSDKADPQRIKESISALMDICEVANRIPEALQWVTRYRVYAPEDSPEYPALRFREARLYRKLGDTNRSQALLEEVVRRAPESPYGKAAAAELHTFEVSRDLQSFMPGAGNPSPRQTGKQQAQRPQGQPQPQAQAQTADAQQQGQREGAWSWSKDAEQQAQPQ